MEWNRDSRNKSCENETLVNAQCYVRWVEKGRNCLLIRARKIRTWKKTELDHYFTLYAKFNPKLIKALRVQNKTLKHLVENVSGYLWVGVFS